MPNIEVHATCPVCTRTSPMERAAMAPRGWIFVQIDVWTGYACSLDCADTLAGQLVMLGKAHDRRTERLWWVWRLSSPLVPMAGVVMLVISFLYAKGPLVILIIPGSLAAIGGIPLNFPDTGPLRRRERHVARSHHQP